MRDGVNWRPARSTDGATAACRQLALGSDRLRAGLDDRPDMRAAQRSGQAAWNETIHDLHPLDVARIRHDLDERTVERQRSLVLREVGGACLAKQLRLLPVRALRWDRSPSTSSTMVRPAAERVGEQKRARVSTVSGEARSGNSW